MTSTARPARNRHRDVGQERAVVPRRPKREPLVGEPVSILDRLDSRPVDALSLDGPRERASPRDDGGERGDRPELVDDERECPEELGEGHRRLRDHAELDLPANEPRRDDQGGDDLDQISVARCEEAQVSIHRRDPPEVRHQLVDPAQQPHPEPVFAMEQRDRFGVLADMDQGGSEIRLPIGLPVVQPDERPAQQDRRQRAQRRVADGDDEEQRADRPEHARERDGRQDRVQEDEGERQRGGRERPGVLGDSLIGIVDLGRLLEPEIRPPVEVALR